MKERLGRLKPLVEVLIRPRRTIRKVVDEEEMILPFYFSIAIVALITYYVSSDFFSNQLVKTVMPMGLIIVIPGSMILVTSIYYFRFYFSPKPLVFKEALRVYAYCYMPVYLLMIGVVLVGVGIVKYMLIITVTYWMILLSIGMSEFLKIKLWRAAFLTIAIHIWPFSILYIFLIK